MSDVTEKWFPVYEECKSLLGFAEDDEANINALRETLKPEVPRITDRFYDVLLREEATRKFIEGRVDGLKQTHIHWFGDVLAGSYGREFFDQQFRIGLAHVRIGLPPHLVEAIMSCVRAESFRTLVEGAPDPDTAGNWIASLTKVFDLDLAVINLSYHETRLSKLTKVTGMSRTLLENLISQG